MGIFAKKEDYHHHYHTMKTALIIFALLSLVAFAASESAEVPEDAFESWPDKVERSIAVDEAKKTEESQLLDSESNSMDTAQAGWGRRRRRRRWVGSHRESREKGAQRARIRWIRERGFKARAREIHLKNRARRAAERSAKAAKRERNNKQSMERMVKFSKRARARALERSAKARAATRGREQKAKRYKASERRAK